MGVIEMINPATGERLGELEETSPEAIERAMVHARKAFRRWGNLPLAERLDHINRLRRYIVDHADELAETVVRDTGKVHLEALMTEILLTVDFIKYYEKRAASILKPKKVSTPITLIGRRSWVEYRPMGVVAVISPWNYPFQLAMIPAISALVAGNAVLIKPSEVSPLTGLLIEKVFRKVGFPEDVVQVIHGEKRWGTADPGAPGQDLFHRQRRHGEKGDGRRRGASDSRRPGIGRKGSDDRLRRRRSAPGGERGGRRLHQRRANLHGGGAPLRGVVGV